MKKSTDDEVNQNKYLYYTRNIENILLKLSDLFIVHTQLD